MAIDLVEHSAVRGAARGGEKVVREAELHRTDGIETSQYLVVESDIEAPGVVLELVQGSCPDDGNDLLRLALTQPGESDLGEEQPSWRALSATASAIIWLRSSSSRKATVSSLRLPSVWDPLAYFPLKMPEASGDQAITARSSARAIGISSRSGVRSMRLYSIWTPRTVTSRAIRRGMAACDYPRWRIRDSDIQHLAGPNQVIERAHDLLFGSHVIPCVHPEHVDVIGVEPFQGTLQRLHHRFAVVAGGVRVGTWRSIGVFGG